MDSAPLIGITGKRRSGKDLKGSLKVMGDLPLDVYWDDYAQGIISAGGIPVWLPVGADPTLYIERLDGLLMSGGADIQPEIYGAEIDPKTFNPEPIRDEFEISLLDAAFKSATPVAGICRGLQIINVYSGGSLFQDVPTHAIRDKAPSTEAHTVTMAENSILEEIYGGSRMVNSLHHQSIERIGEGLRVSAQAEDGGVEGIEHEALPVVAVQWHPEMLTSRDSDPLFRWLVEQACAGSSE
ncbi:MAG: gamma-glutamyl-gamma-aminobutyrate hydrolase family protein [Actinomycetota bacterium]|nr:gamma-glutamyl-gamma-aminobutyrate hydrolase family protein [Actinomycetota bacterium]|tara:strand:+ start:877 stop:1596 length:720 start_codon:yes stop_codon:yes gene_type:complete